MDTVQKKTEPVSNPTLDRNRMMLIDAIIELNQALLAGVQASLDSLEEPLPQNTGDKKTSLLIQKRIKEREELLPYLEHMRDSLNEDSKGILAERQAIMNRLNPPVVEEKPAPPKRPARIKEEKKEVTEVVPPPVEKKVKPVFTPEKASAIPVESPKEPVVVSPAVKKNQWESARAVIDTAALAQYESRELKQPVEKDKRRNMDDDTVTHVKSNFFLKRAQKAIADKQYTRAYEFLKKSLELWNRNYAAIVTLADLDFENGSNSKALKGYEKALSIDSAQPSLALKLGAVLVKLKKKNDAWKSFSRAIRLDNNYILAYMERAAVLNDWGKYSEAIADYDKVLQINKNYRKAYRARGVARLMNRNFAPATDDFTRYLIFDQSDASVYYYRGLAKIGNNEWLDGCLDLSTSSDMGYVAAQKVLKKNCE